MRPPSRSARCVARSAAPGSLLPLPVLCPAHRVVPSSVLPALCCRALCGRLRSGPNPLQPALRPLSALLRPLPGFRRGIAFGGADLQGARNFFEKNMQDG